MPHLCLSNKKGSSFFSVLVPYLALFFAFLTCFLLGFRLRENNNKRQVFTCEAREAVCNVCAYRAWKVWGGVGGSERTHRSTGALRHRVGDPARRKEARRITADHDLHQLFVCACAFAPTMFLTDDASSTWLKKRLHRIVVTRKVFQRTSSPKKSRVIRFAFPECYCFSKTFLLFQARGISRTSISQRRLCKLCHRDCCTLRFASLKTLCASHSAKTSSELIASHT